MDVAAEIYCEIV